MSAPMVLAILAGRKTQTRRVAKDITGLFSPEFPCSPLDEIRSEPGAVVFVRQTGVVDTTKTRFACPYGAPGDRLWVKEVWRPHSWSAEGGWGHVCYGADWQIRQVEGPWSFGQAFPEDRPADRWRSPIFMPRWASRLTLEITGTRVERLGRLSEADALAEGINHVGSRSPILTYAKIWDTINSKRGFPWRSDPWVWIVEFRRAQN